MDWVDAPGGAASDGSATTTSTRESASKNAARLKELHPIPATAADPCRQAAVRVALLRLSTDGPQHSHPASQNRARPPAGLPQRPKDPTSGSGRRGSIDGSPSNRWYVVLLVDLTHPHDGALRSGRRRCRTFVGGVIPQLRLDAPGHRLHPPGRRCAQQESCWLRPSGRGPAGSSEAQTPLALVVPDRLDALAIGRHRLLRRDLIAATRSAHGLGGCPGPLEERGELPATTAHIVRSSALRSSRPCDTNVGVEVQP